MEIILAIVVVSAVIFFGALISLGNERQRRAIESLREQTLLWAMQDLHIKRERLAREARVDDPLGWLNKVTTKACGYDLKLRVVQAFEEPQALSCTSGDSSNIVISPLSPTEIARRKRERKSRLSQYTERNPLLSMPRNITTYEISVLNGGIFFDLELQLAWKVLAGPGAEQIDRLWLYVFQ